VAQSCCPQSCYLHPARTLGTRWRYKSLLVNVVILPYNELGDSTIELGVGQGGKYPAGEPSAAINSERCRCKTRG